MIAIVKLFAYSIVVLALLCMWCVAKLSGRCSRIEERMEKPLPKPTPEQIQRSWDMAMADYFGGQDE